MEAPKLDYLILLVGGNPLPNAVAGELLAQPNTQVCLLHSAGTQNAAKQSAAWLKRKEINAIFDSLIESDPLSISKAVKRVLKNAKIGHRVGLNYTGGTKAMAVHAYRTVTELQTEKGFKTSFSYLDARGLKITFDDSPESPLKLGTSVKPTFEALFTLHQRDLNSSTPSAKIPTSLAHPPMLASAATALCVINGSGSGGSAWSTWKTENG